MWSIHVQNSILFDFPFFFISNVHSGNISQMADGLFQYDVSNCVFHFSQIVIILWRREISIKQMFAYLFLKMAFISFSNEHFVKNNVVRPFKKAAKELTVS